MRVRAFTPPPSSDLDFVTEITNHYIRHTVINFHYNDVSSEDILADWQSSHDRYPWLVAEDETGGRIIGFAKASCFRPRAAYDPTCEVTVYVHPEHRSRGVGTALYKRLFEILLAQGFCTFIAGITLPNEASVRLHESFGMTHAGTFNKVGYKFSAWHDVGFWQRHVDGPHPVPRTAISPTSADPTSRR